MVDGWRLMDLRLRLKALSPEPGAVSREPCGLSPELGAVSREP